MHLLDQIWIFMLAYIQGIPLLWSPQYLWCLPSPFLIFFNAGHFFHMIEATWHRKCLRHQKSIQLWDRSTWPWTILQDWVMHIFIFVTGYQEYLNTTTGDRELLWLANGKNMRDKYSLDCDDIGGVWYRLQNVTKKSAKWN